MSSASWVPVVCAAAAAALLVPHRPALVRDAAPQVRSAAVAPAAWSRWLGSAGAGLVAITFVPGPPGAVAAVLAAAVAWSLVGRLEPAAVRAERAAVRRDLPYVVALLAATLRAGAGPADGITQVCAALPGPAADRLAGAAARLSLGIDPGHVWSGLGDDPQLAGLGRTLARAHETGAPVVTAVERLADDLARDARSDTEDRARAVGVRAAVPLGLCLLPAFVLIGIVPLVVALLAGLDL